MQPDNRLTLFVNPFSKKAAKVAPLIKRILISKEISFLEGWEEDISTCSEAWIIGGDGTINYFLNKYHAPSIPLVFFKAGTGNDIHWKLYGDMDLETQIELLLNTEPRAIDCATCNERYYINSAGLGFDGEVLRSIDMIRWMGGHFGYLFAVIKKIFSFKEFKFKIMVEQESVQNRYLLVAVNNSSRTGGGFMITPNASITDGKLDILLCKPLSIFKRLKYLPVIKKGNHLSLPFIIYSQAKTIRIECEKNIYGQLDGELISGRSFVFNNLTGRLLVRY